MTDINKQKFLAELGKLLTFMYEEDRLLALSMYEDMFACCNDEQQLIQYFISPTRQAVVLARAYDSKERMLSVNTQSRREELNDEEVPRFVSVIEDLKAEAARRFGTVSAPDADQFSLFSHKDESEAALISEEVPAPEELPPEHDADKALIPAEDSTAVAVTESSDIASAESIVESYVQDEPDDRPFADERPRRVRTKRSVPLLILYIILAVPLTLLGTALLLIPTVIFLALAVVAVVAGLGAISCAFGSFAVFADILVVLGTGLIFMALGLLFLWIFVWFIGGAIAGFINAVIRIGDKFSSREVAA